MIIDGHSHACGIYLTPESIIDALDTNGVDQVVLVPGESESDKNYSLPNLAKFFPNLDVLGITNPLIKFLIRLTYRVREIPAGNRYVHDLSQETQGRVIQFLWMTKHVSNYAKYLDDRYGEWGFYGVKLHQCWESFTIDSSFFRQVALWAEEHDIPLFFHAYSHKEVLKLIEYKKQHPELKLIVAHLYGMELFQRQKYMDENLYFDISPLRLVSNKRLIGAIEFFGIEKMLFGTDTPYGEKDNLKSNLNRIMGLEISKESKQLVLGGNMKRLLNL